MPKFRVEVDREACQGFGACQEVCPSHFKVSEVDSKTTIKGGRRVQEGGRETREVLEVSGELGCIRDGAEACPYNAIHVYDLERNIQLV